MAGFNKMFVMVPVMLAARKIDGEDPNIVYWLRVAYAVVQTICVLIVVYTYVQSSAVSAASGKNQGVVYVSPPPQPFAGPDAKKKYTEVAFGAHVLTTARSLLGSTLFGVAMTVGLHIYKGMIVGLAIQTIMGPLNLLENPLVKALILGNGIKKEEKIFEEKTAAELTAEDEVIDEHGNAVVRQVTDGTALSATVSFEDLLLDTWDAGNKADVGALMSAITKKNCNYRTKENGWTPLMILAGLSAKGTTSAIRQVKELGGNPAIVDVEGWNAMHWACFHGSLEGAKELGLKDKALLLVKDKEGTLPLDMARAEGNEEVAKLIESLEMAANLAPSDKKADNGVRKRK